MGRRERDRTASLPPAEAHGVGHRHERLQQLMAEELAGLLRDEVTNPILDDVRLERLELSVDYRAARVAFYTLAEAEETRASVERLEHALEKATPFLRRRLGEALDLKRLPELRFVYDRLAAGEARAAKLLAAEHPAPPPPAIDEDEEDGEGEDEVEDEVDEG